MKDLAKIQYEWQDREAVVGAGEAVSVRWLSWYLMLELEAHRAGGGVRKRV